MKLWAGAACFGVFVTNAITAQAVERSLRPMIRPPVASETVQRASTSVIESLRPETRSAPDASPMDHGFQNWIAGFRTRAMAQGISAPVLDAAFTGVRYDSDAIARDSNQSEFTKTIWEYLDSAASETRIANGKAALRDHGPKLAAIEARYGVEKEIVAAIWGLESAYGTFRGKTDIVTSLATLAYDGRRGAFFEQQLIAALKILQNGDTSPRNMTGSWAGAMGHTQFMPTSYLEYAVDFTGDGRRDIWSDDPSDALASTAAYLARFGWTKGQPWGVEVVLPRGFDFRLAGRDVTKTPADWARLGVRDVSGKPVPNHGEGAILLPAGGQGAAFMIFDNFRVIERYNNSTAYVIGVGHLGDRLKGGGPIQGAWPRSDRALTRDERVEMQQRLTARGFNTQGVDGRIGPRTVSAVRSFQIAQGMAPDGYASRHLLDRLR